MGERVLVILETEVPVVLHHNDVERDAETDELPGNPDVRLRPILDAVEHHQNIEVTVISRIAADHGTEHYDDAGIRRSDDPVDCEVHLAVIEHPGRF